MKNKPNRKFFIIALAVILLLGLFSGIFFSSRILAAIQRVEKWGWIGSSEGSTGGVSLLSFDYNNRTSAAFDYGVDVETDPSDCIAPDECPIRGWAWLGSYDFKDSSAFPIGWMEFPDLALLPATDKPAYVTDSPQWNPGNDEVSGYARIRSISLQGRTTLGQNDWGWVKLRGEYAPGDDYGVTFDPGTNRFGGWAWSGNGTSDGTAQLVGSGLGWIQFDMLVYAGVPYLQVEEGDVYSGRAIIGEPGLPENATYLILASGDITNFVSAQTDTVYEQKFVDPIEYPEEDQADIYRSTIAKIDINALEAGRYGNEVEYINWVPNPSTFSLDNKVYIENGDLNINQPLSFNPFGQFGNGTIIVRGDLNINENITYFTTPTLNDMNKLPSVAWIVQGNINIAPSVTDLAGDFIALEVPAAPSGKITTGTTGTNNDQPLVVSGIMVAHEFAFQRTAVEEYENPVPSEKIIYDGRLLANTPPGLGDFAKTLPRLSELAPHEVLP
ncbi:hypothetical protein KKC88_03305 [Patescibacteria group bacterium]|nr:hypothetical protein [Patescibacteria group bacterium]MBU1673010.1 hypothetical protein [Patescibacteria group bacterium]MBU1964169.1 hypothetical protein [Patescibacteria group bacterium]